MTHPTCRMAVYSGTFDPITLGHLDVIARATRLADRLVVAVAKAHHKKTLFSHEERLAQVRAACTYLPATLRNAACEVVALPLEGLLVDFCRTQDATLIIKGLRHATDLDVEAQMARMNEKLAPSIQTVFVLPTPSVQCISSTLVREISQLGGSLSHLVTPDIEASLRLARSRSQQQGHQPIGVNR